MSQNATSQPTRIIQNFSYGERAVLRSIKREVVYEIWSLLEENYFSIYNCFYGGISTYQGLIMFLFHLVKGASYRSMEITFNYSHSNFKTLFGCIRHFLLENWIPNIIKSSSTIDDAIMRGELSNIKIESEDLRYITLLIDGSHFQIKKAKKNADKNICCTKICMLIFFNIFTKICIKKCNINEKY